MVSCCCRSRDYSRCYVSSPTYAAEVRLPVVPALRPERGNLDRVILQHCDKKRCHKRGRREIPTFLNYRANNTECDTVSGHNRSCRPALHAFAPAPSSLRQASFTIEFDQIVRDPAGCANGTQRSYNSFVGFWCFRMLPFVFIGYNVDYKWSSGLPRS